MKIYLLAFGAFLIPALSHAELSSDHKTCLLHAGDNTVQANLCWNQELTRQDARLNKAYGALAHQLAKKPDERAALKAEETSWLHKRDYDCKVDSTTTAVGCVAQKTSDRADELEKRLKF